jgi:endonuclease III
LWENLPMGDIDDIIGRLEASFGAPERGTAKDPLSELIFTILSQNTTDKNRDRAYETLRGRFARWEDVSRADPSQIEEAIRVGGLGPQKSKRIKAILGEIHEKTGRLSLDYLTNLSPNEARQALLAFNGVGAKTAAVVLLFSLDMPAFPVDTHILRVSRRLGLIPPNADAAAAHVILGALIPPEKYYPTHINLITLGRSLCKPRNPRCTECPVLPRCRFGHEFIN